MESDYGSLFNSFTLNDEFDNDRVKTGRPRILLMGKRRSGKTSIAGVLFKRISPHETLFLHPTSYIEHHQVTTNRFVTFDVLDLTGEYDPDDSNFKMSNADLFANVKEVIYVIDAHDEDHTKSVNKLVNIVKNAKKYCKEIQIVIFIHKMDGDMFHDDDHRMDTITSIQSHIRSALDDSQVVYSFPTSIYDNTIFEAFSKAVQKIQVKQLEYMERLMNSLTTSCGMEKTFLFDVSTKLYLCTDSNPVDPATLELCSTMIDVVLDVSEIYGAQEEEEEEDSTSNGIFRSSGWFNEKSSSVIRLNSGSLSGMVLYLKEIHTGLALVCLVRGENFKKQGVIDFNIQKFRLALGKLFKIQLEKIESKKH